VVAFCGALLLSVGIGIGLRHVLAVGMTLLALVGLAALASGLALLVLGGRRLLRGLGWRNAAAIPAFLLGVALVTWTVSPAVAVAIVPDVRLGKGRPTVPFEDVTFRTADGAAISAWYLPTRNGAAVVLRHGSGSTRTGVLAEAEVLARHGYGVLMTDARGHGDSGGRGMDLGWYGDADIRSAVSWLAARDDVDPRRIAVAGSSMGGEEALGAAAADSRIAAVVAEGATARTDGDKSWYVDAYGLRGRVQLGLEWVQYGLVDLLTPADEPQTLAAAAAAMAPRPALLIAAGTLDEETSAAGHIRAAAPDNVEVWVVPHAGHTQGLRTDPAGWEARVISFLEKALPGPPEASTP